MNDDRIVDIPADAKRFVMCWMSRHVPFTERPPKDYPPIDLSESLDGDRDVAGPKCDIYCSILAK